MITQEEILELVQSKVPELKKIKGDVDGIPTTFSVQKNKEPVLIPPDFNSTYARAVRLFNRIRPHAESDCFPYELFRTKAPGQQPAEFEYCKSIFRITGTPTSSYWAKAVSKVNRIWNEKNYTIKYPEIDAVEFAKYPAQDYFEKDFPDFKAIETYFREIITPMKLVDPNAWAVLDIKPVYSESEPLEPYVCVIPCYKVIDFKQEHYLLSLSDEKSLIKVGGYMKREGFVFEYRDKTGLYKIEQTGKQIDWTFSEPELIHAWNLDYFPGRMLKGNPKYKKDKLYYESYFEPAISSLNTALLDANTLIVSKFAGAFPERWEYVDDCDAPGCDGGQVRSWADEIEQFHTCTACEGTGRKNYNSPLAVKEIPIAKSANISGPDTAAWKPPFSGYIEKNEVTEMLRFIKESVESECIEAFSFINIDVSNSDVKGSDTALGKQIDREELFSFLMSISNETFELLEFMINACGKVRYGNAWKSVEIGYPQNFAIRSDQDLTDEIAKARESNLPAVAVDKLIKDYFNCRFNSQTQAGKIFTLITKTDSLLPFNSTEVLAKLASETISKWQAILHDKVSYFILKAERENKNFWELDEDKQIEIIEGYAKAEDKEISTPKVTPEEIFAQQQANKAEAANKLRSTVGGIEAFLQVIQSVAFGTYDIEAAVRFVMDTFGLTEDEARAQIGTPSKVPGMGEPEPPNPDPVV